MGLYDAMNASVTGMNAQSNYLSNIGQNISNSSTAGYKQADTQFSTMVNSTAVGQTASGGVMTSTRILVDKTGTLSGTSSVTDLAVSGNGFFVVSDSAGQNYLTRAGSFVPDKDGNLVNAAGYYLMGYDLIANSNPVMASNSLTGMEKVQITSAILPAHATTSATFYANVPSTAVAGETKTSSIVTYDSQGAEQTFIATFTRAATADNWDVNIANASAPATSIGSATLVFDPTTGKLTAASPKNIVTSATGTPPSVTIDLAGMTEYATAYSVSKSKINDGNAASSISSVAIDTDGTLSYQLANGSTVSGWKIPLASVPSANNMLAKTGNVFSPNIQSGQATVGVAGTGKLGMIKSSTLEGSTVDVATELTNMIVAQRNYQANSKVFSTGAQLMDTLVNLQV